MQPHTRDLIAAFMRQMYGALAAVKLFLDEEDRLNNQPKQPENQRTLRLPKNPK